MNQEIELKLAFPPAARAAILRHPLLKSAQKTGSTQTLVNTYFDTPDMKLSARRIALRTRKAGKLWLQTVKCAAESVGGLSSRPEWEQAFDGAFDYSAVSAPKVRRLLEKHANDIAPLFTTNFRRDTFILTPAPGIRVHLMIDTGEVSANDRSEVISELELELETGNADDLLALASELSAKLPLTPFDASKAARGYRLFRGESVRATQPCLPALDTTQTALQAFKEAAFLTLGAWTSNQYGAIHHQDPEFIHQLRLSLRQMSGLIRMYAQVLPADFVEHWRPALARLCDQLACARDLEVLCSHIIEPPCADDSDQRLPPLLAHARHEAQAAATRLRHALASAGAGTPLLAMSRALHALPTPADQPSLKNLARQELFKLYSHARKQLELAQTEHSPANLHELRLSIKRINLAARCFSNLFPNKSNTPQLAKLSRLQSGLGQLHDLTLAIIELNKWARAKPQLREGVAFLSGWHAATSLKLRRRILPRCARLLASKT